MRRYSSKSRANCCRPILLTARIQFFQDKHSAHQHNWLQRLIKQIKISFRLSLMDLLHVLLDPVYNLQIIFDKNLSFVGHIIHLSSTCIFATPSSTSPISDCETAYTITNSVVVYSKLHYCTPFPAGTCGLDFK